MHLNIVNVVSYFRHYEYCGGVRCKPRPGRRHVVAGAKITGGGKSSAGFLLIMARRFLWLGFFFFFFLFFLPFLRLYPPLGYDRPSLVGLVDEHL